MRSFYLRLFVRRKNDKPARFQAQFPKERKQAGGIFEEMQSKWADHHLNDVTMFRLFHMILGYEFLY